VENKDRTLVTRMARAALYAIHSVFPPPEVTGHEGGKDPILQKKSDKGDAKMARTKEILGFIVEGVCQTVQLPQAKADTICAELAKLLKKKRCSSETAGDYRGQGDARRSHPPDK
jgi:hypothetical protein